MYSLINMSCMYFFRKGQKIAKEVSKIEGFFRGFQNLQPHDFLDGIFNVIQ